MQVNLSEPVRTTACRRCQKVAAQTAARGLRGCAEEGNCHFESGKWLPSSKLLIHWHKRASCLGVVSAAATFESSRLKFHCLRSWCVAVVRPEASAKPAHAWLCSKPYSNCLLRLPRTGSITLEPEGIPISDAVPSSCDLR